MTYAARAPEETDVVVVGGGMTGLAAGRDLARSGVRVTLIDPASPGGKVRTTPFDGALLDESADAFLARVPDAVDLCRELGMEGDLVAPGARRAYVWSRGALRLLPEGQVLGVPTDLDELAASEILSPEGLARARLDLEVPMQALNDDVAIGALMRSRLGDEVADRLVDPLVGGINAGNTDDLSLAATVPQLDAAARSGAPSLIEACRAQRAAISDPTAPVFFAPRAGMGALVDAVHEDATASGLVTLCGSAAGLERDGSTWRLMLTGGQIVRAAAVIIAAPAGVAADLVGRHAPVASALLSEIPYASVAMISIAVERAAVERELDGSGFLVPRVEARTITACSWASSKWPHLAGDDAVWLRASVGRDGDDRGITLDDETLVQAALADLADTMCLRGAPHEIRVTRWPASLPQYRVGHLERVAQIEDALASVAPSVVVSGAALRGLGVPACVRQGRAAAQKVLTALSPRPG